MKPQTALNRIWKHFIVDEKPWGLNADAGKCQYRTAEGNSCAVGCLMTDEQYARITENQEPHEISTILGWLEPETDRMLLSVLELAQFAHDHCAINERALRRIADRVDSMDPVEVSMSRIQEIIRDQREVFAYRLTKIATDLDLKVPYGR